MIIIRNETQDGVSFTYNDEEVVLEPNKSVQVDSLDNIMLDETIVKIRKGVVKIKGVL